MKQLKVKFRAERNIWVVDTRRAGINTPNYGSFKTESEAREAADELLAKFTLGMVVKKDLPTISVREAIEQFLDLQMKRVDNGQIADNYRKETITNLAFASQYKIDGKKFIDHDITKLVQPTNQQEILLGFEKCIKNEKKSKPTEEKRLKYIKAFLNYCTNKRWIMYNPLDKFTFGKSSDLSDRAPRIQEGVIQAVIKNGLPAASLKEKAMVIIALATGMRQGELRALPWVNIDFNEGEIIVDRAIKKGTSITGTTKTKRGNRTIPIDEKSMKVLKEWKMQSKFSDANDFVFGSGVNTVMLSKYFAPICKKICDAAGVEVLRWSDFRHCFASNQLSGLGEDWAEVARLMGHATPSFTYQQYGHYVKNVAKNNKARNASAAAMYG